MNSHGLARRSPRVLNPTAPSGLGTSHVIHSVGFAMQQLGFSSHDILGQAHPPPIFCRISPRHRTIMGRQDKKSATPSTTNMKKPIAASK